MSTNGVPQKQTLAEGICDVLFDAAASNELPVTEQFLADRFQVSRTPVREVLHQLEGDGLIERRQRHGIRLRQPSPKEVVELYELRAVLEGHAARLAAHCASREDVEYLADCARRCTENRRHGDARRAEQAHVAFHRKIVDLSGNDLLRGVMGRFSIIRRAFRIEHGVPENLGDSDTLYPHEDLVELIRSGDAEGSEAFIKAHILRAKELVLHNVWGLGPPLPTKEIRISDNPRRGTQVGGAKKTIELR